jgi:hypothetical protein
MKIRFSYSAVGTACCIRLVCLAVARAVAFGICGISICIVTACKKDEPARIPSPEDARNAPPLVSTPPPVRLQAPNEPHVAESNEQPLFVMNRNLLGATIVNKDYNFSFAPPKTWRAFSSQEMRVSAPPAMPSGSGMITRPLYGFRNDSSGATLLIMAIEITSSLRDSSFVAQMEEYAPLVQMQFPTLSVVPSGYIKGNMRIVQFLMQSKQAATYRLVFSNKRQGLVCLEFVLPRRTFRKDLEALEPTIASLSLLKE